MNTLIFRTVAPFLTALMVLFSIFVLLRGHNEPGGGFVSGLVLSIGLLLQYIISGTHWVESHMPIYPRRWIAAGLLIALATGLGSWYFGYPFLTSHTAHLTLPLVGEIHVASALFFDLGVYLLVVGSTMLMLTGIAHQSVRGYRYHERQLGERAATVPSQQQGTD